MEMIDLYRAQYERTGEIQPRGQKLPPDRAALIVFVCIFNSKGQMLIQQRHPAKSWGGLWDVSAGGAVQSGEDSRDAAVREVCEELGLRLAPQQLVPILSLYYDGSIHVFYTAEADVETERLVLQPDEVAAARWVDEQEACAMNEKGLFIPVYSEFLSLVFRMKTRKGIMK